MDIVSWTLRSSRYDQNKPIHIDASDPSRFLSADGTRTLVRKLVSGFQKNGLLKGDTVCMLSFNEINYTSLFLGIIGAGGIFSGANPGYTTRELVHHLRMTSSTFLLTEINTLNVAIAAAEEVGIPQSSIFVLNYRGEKFDSVIQSWFVLLSHGEKDWVQVGNPNLAAAYVSTSGTSGLPKAAVIPHSYLISQGQFQEKRNSRREEVSQLIAVPPFHVFTIPVQHSLPLRKGVPCYIMPRFLPSQFLDALESFRITNIVTVPPIMMALSKAPRSKLKSLRNILVGGSCATYGMQEQLYEILSPEARIVQVYGMTEVGWATMWGRKSIDRTGSVGQPVTGTKLRVVDQNGDVLSEPGRTGNIQIFSRTAMRGYLHNSNATVETITPDGWVQTGDVGYVRNGNWYVIDRTKDLIKVRGWQVSPAEVEAALLEHPDIVDAGVIGVAAKDGCGETPIAFVVKKVPSDVEENKIKAFLDDRLARYKNVDEVVFIDQIPRNPTGKILRRALRDMRTKEPLTPDQAAAEAYSSALRGLFAKQMPKISEVCDVSSSSQLISPPSTVSSSPILIEAPALGSILRSKKRKCSFVESPTVRRKL